MLQDACLTIHDVAGLWRASPDTVRRLFRGRKGVMRLGRGHSASYRIPASMVIEEMIKHGFDPEKARQLILRRMEMEGS